MFSAEFEPRKSCTAKDASPKIKIQNLEVMKRRININVVSCVYVHSNCRQLLLTYVIVHFVIRIICILAYGF